MQVPGADMGFDPAFQPEADTRYANLELYFNIHRNVVLILNSLCHDVSALHCVRLWRHGRPWWWSGSGVVARRKGGGWEGATD